MKLVEPSLFKNKKWGTATVLKDTLIDLTHKKVKLLETRNDVDIYDDIKDLRVFQPFLKNI